MLGPRQRLGKTFEGWSMMCQVGRSWNAEHPDSLSQLYWKWHPQSREVLAALLLFMCWPLEHSGRASPCRGHARALAALWKKEWLGQLDLGLSQPRRYSDSHSQGRDRKMRCGLPSGQWHTGKGWAKPSHRRWPRLWRGSFASFHKPLGNVLSRSGPTPVGWTPPGNLLKHTVSAPPTPTPDLLDQTLWLGMGPHNLWSKLPSCDADVLWEPLL